MAEENKEAPKSTQVTITVTADGKSEESQCRFHTPTLLEAVKKSPDGCTVKMTVTDPGAKEPRTLMEGKKEEVIKAITASIVPAGSVANELRKFAQFLLDHSDLRAVGVSAIIADGDKDAGFGFVNTAENCTMAQAVSFVNCCDANADEFVAKAKIDIPERARSAKNPIVMPTRDEVEKLG